MTPPPKKTYTDQEKIMFLLQMCAQMNMAAGRTIERLKGVDPRNSLTLPGTQVQEMLKDMETILKGTVSFSTMYQRSPLLANKSVSAPPAPANVAQSLTDITARVKQLSDSRKSPAKPTPAAPAQPPSMLERLLGEQGWLTQQCTDQAPLPGLVPSGLSTKPWKPSEVNGLPAFQEDLLEVPPTSLKHYPQGYYCLGTTEPRVPQQLYLTQGPSEYLVVRSVHGWDVYVSQDGQWRSIKTMSTTVVSQHFEAVQKTLLSALHP